MRNTIGIPEAVQWFDPDLQEEILLHRRISDGVTLATGARSGKSLVVKTMTGEQGFERAEAEWLGLVSLRATGAFRIPHVLAKGAGVLVMESIRAEKEGWTGEAFGRALAEMHCTRGPGFGWSRSSFCGPTVQDNTLDMDWPRFFLERRLLPLCDRLGDAGRSVEDSLRALTLTFESRWKGVCAFSSLVHGDLWQGNYIEAGDRTALIDPATYWGHGEVDVAMLHLFGTPPEGFVDGYRSILPIEEGLDWRMNFYNLYHLLNHACLFGHQYLQVFADNLRKLEKKV